MASEAGVGDRDVVLGGDELGLPDPASAGLWSRKCMTAPPTPRIAGMASSPGPTRLLEGLGAEGGGALDGGGGVLDPEADVADADAVGEVGGMGEALALGVDDEVDAALAVEGHVLGDVAAGLARSPCRGRSATSARRGLGRGGELDELDAGDRDAVGHRRQIERGAGSARWTWSIRATSERWPSTAIARGEPPRNWSLKISSESQPS